MPASSDSIGSLEISTLSLAQLNDRLRRIGNALSAPASPDETGSWIAWTPAVSVSAPMTATAASVYSATSYLRVGSVVHFRCRFTTTLGGTLGGGVLVSGIPVAEFLGSPVMLTANVNGSTQSIVAYIAGSTITVTNSVAFSSGANTFTINGTYQCG